MLRHVFPRGAFWLTQMASMLEDYLFEAIALIGGYCQPSQTPLEMERIANNLLQRGNECKRCEKGAPHSRHEPGQASPLVGARASEITMQYELESNAAPIFVWQRQLNTTLLQSRALRTLPSAG